ncbi:MULTISPECIES: hypothetical protein [Brenneria]|uniref:Uncharacterized protein n=1 Tax=Brenneria nigrifluens DSM 30175 = ATCC 13028 TaxID=1121120 RepID=A0ABX5V573_9GAMM|nr:MULTISPECIES: hypothetical protein [Brenneria]QCR05878.1 hypothetical protein EH206_17850 [Brenneria nigrifluens DSM 30175 = ATCC 13028]
MTLTIGRMARRFTKVAAGKGLTILIHQALLSGREAFCAGENLHPWQQGRKGKLFFAFIELFVGFLVIL